MSQFSGSTFGRYAGRRLIVTGAFELVLGAGFVAGSLYVPLAAVGFLLTGAILGITSLA